MRLPFVEGRARAEAGRLPAEHLRYLNEADTKVEPASSRPLYNAFKRAFDALVAIAALAVTLPFMALVALAIRLDSPGPLLIRQVRLGRGGRPFVMYKFRTMREGSEDLSPELHAANEKDGPLFKIRRDPRITRVGRLLRRASLDELPQLFNVLLGHMSLVGPRPPLPRELAGFAYEQLMRLRVRPGLTGLWQISGRSDLPFEEMMRLDLEYIDRRSFVLDVWIIARTVPTVLRGHGAY